MKHTAFFGDGVKTFDLTPELIRELERKSGHGIGAVFQRITNQQFAFTEILETIRLGLIGGGTAPSAAADLIATYGAPRPIAETLELAVAILAARYFGQPEAPVQPLDTAPPSNPLDDIRQAAMTGDLAASLNEVSA